MHCYRTCSMDFLKTLATIFSRILIKQVSALKKKPKTYVHVSSTNKMHSLFYFYVGIPHS